MNLSRRQMQVLTQIAEGLGDKEIAAQLDIATSTVSQHVGEILVRLQARNRAQAVAKTRDTFGDVWGLHTGAKGPDTGVDFHRDAALALTNRGNIQGAIEGQAAAIRDSGESGITDQAQVQAKALRGSIQSRCNHT
jgi:ATP/maltotriose-dependent transcriptional regulator MalT